MSKFYTRTGDDGYTGLLGEGRVRKDHLILRAVGAIDEASAALGLARSLCKTEGIIKIILAVQRDLYRLMAEISATPENASRFREIDKLKVSWLEEHIEMLGAAVDQPDGFILPGDSTAGAALALARTIVRRAERHLVSLLHDGSLENDELPRYLNRLSSLCFVFELCENQVWGGSGLTLAKED